MYQYKAVLKSTKEVIAEDHTVEGVENAIKHFKRMQKKGEHTRGNEPIEIIHVKRSKLFGRRRAKQIIIKVI